MFGTQAKVQQLKDGWILNKTFKTKQKGCYG